jgi:VanZ family protein
VAGAVVTGAVVAAAVLALTVGPVPVGGLDTFTALLQRAAPAVGLAPPRRSVAEAVANVLLFLPLGALGVLLTRARWAVGGLVLVSIAIELVQLLLPARTPSARDVALNATGAAVGAAVVLAIRYCMRTPTPTPTPPTES